jgi:hypothetical protein
MAFTIVTVTGTYHKADSSPASGSVTFLATGTMRDTDSDVTITPAEITAVLDANGSISVELAANDGEFTTPHGITYEVTERIQDSNEAKSFVTISKTSIAGTVDLADLVPNIQKVITQNYATKEYVDTHLATSAETTTFDPTTEILSTTVQGAIEEVRAKSKFVYTQPSAAILWDITHNLMFFPNVTIVDSGENFVIGDVEYVNQNRLLVTFAHSFAGKAYLS